MHLHHRRRSLAAEPKELSKEMRTASKAAATKVARISKRRVPASGKRSSGDAPSAPKTGFTPPTEAMLWACNVYLRSPV